MISISKEEAIAIKNQFPNAVITVTNKRKHARQKNRYIEEFSYICKAIEEMRSVCS